MSEEQKAINILKNMTTNYSLSGEQLHYVNILYYLIINLQQENNHLKENNQAMQEEMCRTWEKLNIIKELRSWLEAIKTMYENEYKDVNTAEHYNSVLSKLNELENKSTENGKNVQ